MICQSITRSLLTYLGVVPQIVFRFSERDSDRDPSDCLVAVDENCVKIIVNIDATVSIIATILQHINALPSRHKTKEIRYVFDDIEQEYYNSVIGIVTTTIDEVVIKTRDRVPDDIVTKLIKTFKSNYHTDLDFRCKLLNLAHHMEICSINIRNSHLTKRAVSKNVLNIAIALAPILQQLGPYLFLEIIDWTNPHYHMFNHHIKISVLQNLYNTMNKKYQS